MRQIRISLRLRGSSSTGTNISDTPIWNASKCYSPNQIIWKSGVSSSLKTPKPSHARSHYACRANWQNKPRQTSPATGVTTNDDITGHLSEGDLRPVRQVSLNQYMSALHGRLPHTKGKEPKSKKYTSGTIFSDHATQYIFLRHQVSLQIGETLKSKHAFKRLFKENGFNMEEYLTDNAPFHAAEFLNDITNQNQKIRYSGVGAHHQNGKAEQSIRTVTQRARAMLLHHMLHWPDTTGLDLWPFALEQSVYLWNNMPQKRTRLAPIELFTQV
jgi:hypothetical protein